MIKSNPKSIICMYPITSKKARSLLSTNPSLIDDLNYTKIPVIVFQVEIIENTTIIEYIIKSLL